MFKSIIQIILLIYLILVIYHNSTHQKYNTNGYIVQSDDHQTIHHNIQKLNPILMSNTIEYNLSPSDFMYHFKNKELFHRLNIQNDFDNTLLPNSEYNFPIQKSISIIKEKSIPLKTCLHNYNIINVLDGECTIYLFNPKHKEDILHKKNNEIKKWGHKLSIHKGDSLIIPPYWYYIQEVEDGIIQYHIDIDSYFTFIPNFLKETYYSYID